MAKASPSNKCAQQRASWRPTGRLCAFHKAEGRLSYICTGDTTVSPMSDAARFADGLKQAMTARRLAGKIAASGDYVKKGPGYYALWEPYCEAPIRVGKQTPVKMGLKPVEAYMHVPCRKCWRCRYIRRQEWISRVGRECSRHAYNYAVTLTFSPAHLAELDQRCSALEGDHVRLVEAEAYKDVQKFVKRLRKGRAMNNRASTRSETKRLIYPPLKFRFVTVLEKGELRGRLHFHSVFHSHVELPTVAIEREWRSRSECELVKDRSAFAVYVSKYLTKDLSRKPRFSRAYGAGADFLEMPPTVPPSESENF